LKRQPKRKIAESSSESSDEDTLPPHLKGKKRWRARDSSDDDPETFFHMDKENKSLALENSNDASDEIQKKEENISPGGLKCGDYILTNMKTENGTFKEFVAKIVAIENDGNYLGTFLRTSAKIKNAFIYPAVEDIGLIEANEIKKIICDFYSKKGSDSV